MTTVNPLRCGLVGTGHWARITHAPALASTEGIVFAGVWGRSPEAAEELAAAHSTTAYDDLDEFLGDVDAVVFAVPPDVQSPIAVRAARLGRHLLLEKPVALTDADADALVEAVEAAGVASVVFFTSRFQADVRDWLAEVTAARGWLGGRSIWPGAALEEGNPFNTPWRRLKGGLWDLGPHVVSMFWASLGPVVSVTADRGLADITHLILHHASGVTSTATVTLSAPEGAGEFELALWGAPGWSMAPTETAEPVTALRVALTELAEGVRSGRTDHPCDVRFGRDISRVLTAAERQLGSRLA
ncbi:MAG: Gfo/Idh/MocA family protein [Streptosporangiaceae bacterium]